MKKRFQRKLRKRFRLQRNYRAFWSFRGFGKEIALRTTETKVEIAAWHASLSANSRKDEKRGEAGRMANESFRILRGILQLSRSVFTTLEKTVLSHLQDL